MKTEKEKEILRKNGISPTHLSILERFPAYSSNKIPESFKRLKDHVFNTENKKQEKMPDRNFFLSKSKDTRVQRGKKNEIIFGNIILGQGLDSIITFEKTDSLGGSSRAPDLTFYHKDTKEKLFMIEVEMIERKPYVDVPIKYNWKLETARFCSEYIETFNDSKGAGSFLAHKADYFEKGKLFGLPINRIFYTRIYKDWSHMLMVKADKFLELYKDPSRRRLDNVQTSSGFDNEGGYVMHSRKDMFYTYAPEFKKYASAINQNDIKYRGIVSYLCAECGLDLRDLSKEYKNMNYDVYVVDQLNRIVRNINATISDQPHIVDKRKYTID